MRRRHSTFDAAGDEIIAQDYELHHGYIPVQDRVVRSRVFEFPHGDQVWGSNRGAAVGSEANRVETRVLPQAA